MRPKSQRGLMAFPGSALLVLSVLFLAVVASHGAAVVRRQVPAVYVFGDSTADVGNNNDLPGTDAKANFPPNGIDFPHSTPTGRFSNGYNGIDCIVSHMGFRRSPPPYRSLTNNTNRQILKGLRGANFASAGTGILDSTGTAISMTKQIQDFTTLRSNIISRIGIEATNSILSKSIFLISSGGNDVFAFFARNTSPNSTETEKFIAALISNYKRHLKNLYDLGARKFAIVDVAPIGCCPYSRSQHPLGLCLDVLNSLALGVNNASKVLFQELSSSLQGMKYSIGSSYAVVSSIIADPQAVGYKEVKSACCGSGNLNAASGCTPNATYCEDRGHYLFWDRIHPTHATSKRAGVALYGGSLQFASPINFKQLVEDKS